MTLQGVRGKRGKREKGQSLTVSRGEVLARASQPAPRGKEGGA
jgi:hypothetical protein